MNYYTLAELNYDLCHLIFFKLYQIRIIKSKSFYSCILKTILS